MNAVTGLTACSLPRSINSQASGVNPCLIAAALALRASRRKLHALHEGNAMRGPSAGLKLTTSVALKVWIARPTQCRRCEHLWWAGSRHAGGTRCKTVPGPHTPSTAESWASQAKIPAEPCAASGSSFCRSSLKSPLQTAVRDSRSRQVAMSRCLLHGTSICAAALCPNVLVPMVRLLL